MDRRNKRNSATNEPIMMDAAMYLSEYKESKEIFLSFPLSSISFPSTHGNLKTDCPRKSPRPAAGE